ncbi:MAG: hypothetical protein ACR2PH_02565 [Desulfobulbia bacterium]
MEADVFKLLSTIAVFLVVGMWAFKNMRSINDWFATKTGVGKTSDERRQERTTEDGTKIVITTANTSGE